jgi:hypothetical protein
LGIVLFNWCGFQLLHAYLENRATKQQQVKLDNHNYDESELVTLKVPAEHLAYHNVSMQFERVDGQIEIGGLQYSYVKRRLFNDSIEMLCIPNPAAMNLKSVKNDFIKLVNDLQVPGQGGKTDSHASKNLTGDFDAVHDSYIMQNLFYSIQKKSFHYSEKLPVHFLLPCERPPQKTA